MKCTHGKLWESRKHQEDFRSNLTCILNDKKKENRKEEIKKIRHRGPHCAVNNAGEPPRATQASISRQMHSVMTLMRIPFISFTWKKGQEKKNQQECCRRG